MSNNKPFFSVVMPTYNRADLLPLAIQSVLNQTFEDFEIVISNGGSTDNTREVITGFNDPRIRYFESKERLSIGDNYQNGLDNAVGEYITFLGDDDAFAPTMFERVKPIIDEYNAPIIAFHVCHYYHDDDIEFNFQTPISANTLVIPQFTGKLTKFKKKEAMEILFSKYGLIDDRQNSDFITPFLANAVYNRNVFSEISRKRKKLFAVTPADMYLAAAVFFVVDSYYCLDQPLHVWSRWAGNATASINRKGNPLKDHYEKLLNGQKLDYTPLKFALPQNLCANALIQAKKDFDENSDESFRINWASYYINIYDELMNFKSKKIDVSQEVAEFKQTLSEQPNEMQNEVRTKTSSFKFTAKQFIRTKLPFAKNFFKRLATKESIAIQNNVCGGEAGFQNFLEAASFLSTKNLPELLERCELTRSKSKYK